jgi:hypothetical protein
MPPPSVPPARGEGRSGTQRPVTSRCLRGPRCADQAQDALDIGSLLVCQESLHPVDNTGYCTLGTGHWALCTLRQGSPWGIGFVEGDDPVAHADGRRRRTP